LTARHPIADNCAVPDILDPELVERLVAEALAEDRADNDITTRALVPETQQGRAVLIAKAEGVIAGLSFSREAFRAVDASTSWVVRLSDGAVVVPGDRIASVEGRLASILSAERVALNYLTHLSGVATAARDIVRLIQGTSCRLRDTRKTIPGLRAAEKYATRMGGADNHRFDLADGVLIKDNHIAAIRERDLGIADAVRLAREAHPGLKLEIEVTNLEEARQGIETGADELLLDNMPPALIRQIVALAAQSPGRPLLEASGGITAANVREYADTGVDFVSIGAITHSAPALDISLEVEPEGA
jgi:nicotinate-nucleotide pyrophosphorylase (carboxylating)